MENDRSLARFAGQFVPLKLVTSNNPEWGQWSRMYPVDGTGIPRLYVIRADGEKLYAGVGSLSGDKLPLMMLASLRQAGRSFNEAESVKLSEAVTQAQVMLEKGNLLGAAVALSSVTQFGSPDNLGSFAKPALDAGEAYEQLVTQIEERSKAAESNLSGTTQNTEPLDDLITLYEAEASYKLFPKLKTKAGTWTRSVKQVADYDEVSDQAENLVKARVLAAAINPRQRNRAPAAYTSVIRRFPGTEVDELARTELAVIDPDAKILQSDLGTPTPTPTATYREWTSSDGQFTTVAKFLQQSQGKVQLQKEDGTKIVVGISVLSDQDQAYLKSRQ